MSMPLGGILLAIRRRGARAVIEKALDQARERVAPDSTHVWYLLDLQAERPRLPLPPGYVLIEVFPDTEDLALLDALGPNAGADADRRFAAGGRLFTALADGEPAFVCWIFRAIPTRASRGGWVALPRDLRGLEYSFTVEAHRGRGLAPAVWSELSDRLQAASITGLVTKVGLNNGASRRAVEKAGFLVIAHVRVARRRGRLRVDVKEASGSVGVALQHTLSR